MGDPKRSGSYTRADSGRSKTDVVVAGLFISADR